jgi:hypothetical protein
MNQLDDDKFKNVMNILEDENNAFYKLTLLNQFINTASTKPEDVELEAVFFIGKLLEQARNGNYKNIRKVIGIPSIKEEAQGKKKIENMRLISDVNFLVKYKNFKGAQGALEELANNSPYYTNFANLNSLQVTYRKTISDMTTWLSQCEDISQELEGLEGAIKGGALMKYLYMFVGERDPLI